MKFEEALQFLRTGAQVRRAGWRARIDFRAVNIMMVWASGHTENWRPTLADIQAHDWERVR